MDGVDTVSVSKGVFVFKNGFKRVQSRQKRKPVEDNVFGDNLWYKAYQKVWYDFQNDIQDIQGQMYSSLSTDLLEYIKKSYNEKVNEIPTVALLTGINITDHDGQFSALETEIRSTISPHVATLYSQNCQNLKYLMEHMISQFLNREKLLNVEDEIEEESRQKIKKSQFSLSLLQSWYNNLEKNVLVVILPDFESFNSIVLQKFILIISSYINVLPFVLIFGIATSISAFHQTLPYQVTSKISLRIFNSQPSVVYLNKILESKLFLFSPFQLGGKVFNMFTDIFLFYDLSVHNFMQNIRYAMVEHFCYGNAMSLCTMSKLEMKETLKKFDHDDFENVRRLPSFRKFVESETYENRIKLLTNDEYFARIVKEQIYIILKYIKRLHIFLKCLYMLVNDLPNYPLGKQVRELYAVAVSESITESSAYKECFKLLHFQSKDELVTKLNKMIEYITSLTNSDYSKGKNALQEHATRLEEFLELLNRSETVEEITEIEQVEMECEETLTSPTKDRKHFKQALFMNSKQKETKQNHYEKTRESLLGYLDDIFKTHLFNPKSLPFHEIFFFDDVSIKNRIIGMHRSAIHNALNDPHYYLQCRCCETPNSTSIKYSMPDICVAYKLHLECGKMINLYDWLQAFLSIVDPEGDFDESKRVIDPELQARFTQAVAELEYLGFIKSSKRKADHVARLTWGG